MTLKHLSSITQEYKGTVVTTLGISADHRPFPFLSPVMKFLFLVLLSFLETFYVMELVSCVISSLITYVLTPLLISLGEKYLLTICLCMQIGLI